MSTATTTTAIGTFVQAVIAIVKADVEKIELPILLAFLQNVGNNTSEINIAAQVNSLQVNLLASEPNIEQAVVKDLAALLEQDLAAIVSSAGGSAAPTPAPAPAAA